MKKTHTHIITHIRLKKGHGYFREISRTKFRKVGFYDPAFMDFYLKEIMFTAVKFLHKTNSHVLTHNLAP